MYLGVLALVTSSMLFGAILYINLVEQPARQTLVRRAMISEWASSNRRGIVLFSIISLVSSLLGYSEFVRTGAICPIRFS